MPDPSLIRDSASTLTENPELSLGVSFGVRYFLGRGNLVRFVSFWFLGPASTSSKKFGAFVSPLASKAGQVRRPRGQSADSPT